jgi:hypothetical protein
MSEGADFSIRHASAPIAQRLIDTQYNELIVGPSELKSDYSKYIWELDEDLENLYYGINEDIAPLKEDSSIKMNYSPRYSYLKPFVAEVQDVVVAGPDAIGFTNDGSCITDPTDPVPYRSSRGRIGRSIKRATVSSPIQIGMPIARSKPPKSETTEKVAAILHSRWNNYYHWMLEHLPKLRGIERYERATGSDVSLIIPPDPPSYIVQSLELVGFGENRHIEWKEKPIGIDRLVVPSFPSPAPKSIDWIRNRVEQNMEISDPNQSSEWIYISRQRADRRRVVNYDGLRKLLTKYNIRPVFCEDMSLKEEIRLFSNASGVIGPHGAGLTSIIWGNDMHLIEIFNNYIKAPYYVLAHILDHGYTPVSGDPVENRRSTTNRNSNINVNINMLENILSKTIDNV